jgi:hypothetical protein
MIRVRERVGFQFLWGIFVVLILLFEIIFGLIYDDEVAYADTM